MPLDSFLPNSINHPRNDDDNHSMSSVLQVQMLHDAEAGAALKAQFAFMDSPPEAPEEAADWSRMDTGGE